MTLADLSPLANHLWQSTVFAGAMGALTLPLRRNRAAVRYWLWLAASMKFLLPFSLLVRIGNQLARHTPPAIEPPQWSFAVERISQPFAASVAVPQVAATPLVNPVAAVILGVWLCGIAAGIVFWLRSAGQARAARLMAIPLAAELPIPVLSSPMRLEPGVFGIWHPVLLLPEGIADRLTAAQLEMIFAHEMCHVRRRDNLTAALHMIVETLFWFHPLVWWIRVRLLEERERACDEAVIQSGAEPRVYAEGILRVCQHYLESPLASVSGITGSDLKKRIGSIMANQKASRLSFTRKLLLAAAALVSVAGPFIFGLINASQTYAQSKTGPISGPAGQPDAPRVFDVASIKPNLTGGDSRRAGASPGGVFTASNVPLKLLIARAYGGAEAQIEGGPRWIDTDTWEIAAKADTRLEMTREQLRPCLQALLAERFQLVVHRYTRQGDVLSLVAGKDGPKLKEHLGSGAGGIGASSESGKVTITGVKMTMARLAEYLAGQAGHPVVDNTGLKGEYDFRVEWSTYDSDSSGPSVFAALDEQLGLKLNAVKGPIEMIVVDHAEKASAN
jgi:bla regulator protein BlaR1